VLTVIASLDTYEPAKLSLYEDPHLFSLGFDVTSEMFHAIS